MVLTSALLKVRALDDFVVEVRIYRAWRRLRRGVGRILALEIPTIRGEAVGTRFSATCAGIGIAALADVISTVLIGEAIGLGEAEPGFVDAGAIAQNIVDVKGKGKAVAEEKAKSPPAVSVRLVLPPATDLLDVFVATPSASAPVFSSSSALKLSWSPRFFCEESGISTSS